MSGFRIDIPSHRRAAARHVSATRRELQRAFAASGLTVTQLAARIGAHRAVVRRELDGRKDISLSRVGEIMWATQGEKG